MDRFALIARKQEVRRQLERVNRQLEAARNAADPERDRRRIAQLEQQLQTLMAEEYALRLAIDRNR
jgi:phosphotransacetylase